MMNRLGLRTSTPVVAVVVVLAIVSTLHSGCTNSPVVPSAVSTPRPTETLRRAGPVCPTYGSSGAAQTLQGKAGHRVILSWKASAPADSKHEAAVGYCIYRGVKPKDPSPERVNAIPFPGTSCADDSVVDDKKYYYVVRAINDKGTASIISNEALAPIPTNGLSNPSVPGASAPLCREPATLK
jgi:hypothetical protein